MSTGPEVLGIGLAGGAVASDRDRVNSGGSSACTAVVAVIGCLLGGSCRCHTTDYTPHTGAAQLGSRINPVTDPLTTVNTRRNKLHKAAAAGLLPVLNTFAGNADLTSLRLAIDDPDGTNKATRNAQASAELHHQATLTGAVMPWHTANATARTAAVAAGVGAAAHVLSAGEVPAGAADDILNPDDLGDYLPEGWMLDQLGGMGADVAAAIAVGDITDEELQALISADPGALYYLDLGTSQAFLDATNSLYMAAGVTMYLWDTMADERVCSTCDEFEARSPYKFTDIPEVPHGLCRCWTIPE